MRRLILALLATTVGSQLAFAADLPPAPPPAPAPYYKPALPPIFSWTGFYLGLHGGGAFGKKDWSDPILGSLGSHDISGGVAGGQIGFNYQAGPAVFGIEFDSAWAGLRGSHNILGLAGVVGETKVDYLGTLTGRFGVAWGMALLYAKAGGAWVHDKYDVTVAGISVASASETRWGWTVGAGLEYAFTPNWSAKIEYNYMDFGTKTTTFTAVGGLTGTVDIGQTVNVVKAGFNYRFGGPVYAAY